MLTNSSSELPSYDMIIPAALEHGIMNLRENCKLRPGIPLKPMLAKPTKAITEVLDRFEGQTFTCEYKYDGERAQVHLLPDGSVAVFSRNSEDMSKKYPDLVEQLPHVHSIFRRSGKMWTERVCSVSRSRPSHSCLTPRPSLLTRRQRNYYRSRSSVSANART